jgi:type I restriction enzyme S subunit
MTKSHVRDFEKHEFISSAELPNSWQLGKLKYALDRVMSGGTPDSSNAEYWTEKGLGIPWVNIGDMSKHEQVTKTQKEVTELGQSSKKLEVLKSGTIIYSIYATLGAVSELKIDAVINQALLGLYPKDDSEQKFMIYWLRFLRPHLRYFASSSTQFNLNAYKVSNFPYPILDGIEKQNISKFLDKEVSHINNLVQEKQNFIKLLKEKRQALISHVVTKGLNPDLEMKDSGVEWIGEIPSHWVICKINYRYEILLGKMLDEKKIKGDHLGRYLRNTDVQWDKINNENLPQMDFSSEESERYQVRKGDLLVCEGGEIGRCAIWELDEPCFYQKALHRVRPRFYETDYTRFLFYVITDAVNQERFLSRANKSTIAHLPAETFRKYRFAFPGYEEQVKISEYLDKENIKLEKIIGEVKESINLLIERRTALISAAVTGKIDLRDKEVA